MIPAPEGRHPLAEYYRLRNYSKINFVDIIPRSSRVRTLNTIKSLSLNLARPVDHATPMYFGVGLVWKTM
jgi:hypothetical protein